MPIFRFVSVLLIVTGVCMTAATPDPVEIMNRMASSVEASVDARRQYVYKQKVVARLLRTNQHVARQETRIYTVVPGPERTVKTLVSLAGDYYKTQTHVVHYDQPGFEKGGLDIDGDLMRDLINDLVDDKDSRDGIPHDLFPLRKKDLAAYRFTFKEETEVKGRKAYRIAFEPAHRSTCLEIGSSENECGDNKPWKGEVLVDAEEFQPVRIFTDLAFKMPWGVKVFLGTNVRQIGFSIAYSRLAPNVWFPVSYGTEFRLDVLFGYHRVITLALDSSEFQRTAAQSEIKYAPPQ